MKISSVDLFSFSEIPFSLFISKSGELKTALSSVWG